MVIKEIQAKNFLSFKDLKLEFQKIAQVIQGENLDEDDQEANGTGRSTIFYLLEQLLFGSTSKGGVESDLVMWGEKSSWQYMEIYCPMRKETLQIERNILDKPKLSLHIVSDSGERDELEFPNTNVGNKMLLDWVGITKEDLQNYYLINNKKYSSFMTSPNTAKIDMLSRLTNLNPLDKSKEVIEDMVKDKEKEISALTNTIKSIEGVIQFAKDEIEDENNRDLDAEFIEAKASIEKEIEDLKTSKNHIYSLIGKNNERLEQVKKEVDHNSKLLLIKTREMERMNSLLVEPDFKGINRVIDQREKRRIQIKEKIKENNKSISEALEMVNEFGSIVSGSVTCPKCAHVFNPADTFANIEEERERLQAAKNILKSLQDASVKLEEAYREQGDYITKLEEQKRKNEESYRVELNKLAKINRELNAIDNTITKLEREIDSINSSVELHEQSLAIKDESILACTHKLENLKKGKIDLVRIKRLKADIKEKEGEISKLNEELSKLLEEQRLLGQWHFNFSKFKGELARESLNVITERQNIILKGMRSDLRVRWEGFKLNKDGSLSDKITPLIIRNGNEKPFSVYSGGERGRIEYSSILTNQYLINSVHPYGGLDFLFTDEVVEGIDARGLMNIVDSLSSLGITILLTTHVVNQSVSTKVLTVRKKNGVSEIINN